MAEDSIKKVEIKISGMSCAHCAARVEKSLKSVEGVEEAQVDLEKGKATIEYDSNQVELSKLEDAVEEAGYSVAN
jgi:copper ion binding protein